MSISIFTILYVIIILALYAVLILAVPVFLIYLLFRLLRSIKQDRYNYYPNPASRIGAFLIDVIVIRTITVFFTGRIREIIFTFFRYGPIFLIGDVLYEFFSSLLILALTPFSIIFLLLITGFNFPFNFVFCLVAFFYFLVSELIFEGRTIGKCALKLRTVQNENEQEITPLKIVLNSFVKSFFLFPDVIIGRIKKTAAHQVRYVEQITGIKVIRTGVTSQKEFVLSTGYPGCSKCGYRILPGAKFCVNCGHFTYKELATELPIHSPEKEKMENLFRKEAPQEDLVQKDFPEELEFCIECGCKIFPNARFCVKCGKPLDKASSKPLTQSIPQSRIHAQKNLIPIFCLNCGYSIPVNAKFCVNCGEKFG